MDVTLVSKAGSQESCWTQAGVAMPMAIALELWPFLHGLSSSPCPQFAPCYVCVDRACLFFFFF